MQVFRNLGLRTKIALPFGITAAALIVIGILNALTVRELISDTNRIATNYLPSVSKILNGDRDLYQAYVAQIRLVDAMSNDEDTEAFLESFNENAQQARDRFDQASDLLSGSGAASIIQGFDDAFSRWEGSARKVMQTALNGSPEEARALAESETAALFSNLRDYYDKLGALADEQAANRAKDSAQEGMSSSITTGAVTVLAIILSLVLFLFFMRLIIGSISAVRRQLDAIAQGKGDLTQRIPVEVKDDLGRLADSFNQVLANLQSMIRSIQELSNGLGDGAGRLATAAQENNDGVSRQTDSIAMVATAINEMQSAIEEVAGNASRAAEITREAEQKGRDNARIIGDSSRQVHSLAAQTAKAAEAIRKLSEDSDNITSVLDVIRGIAEQTNLLALNAAIEAARAGEQGRGFAVVADEVRTLAQRTQQSTEDIQTMITALQGGVSEVVSVMEVGSREAAETEKLATEAESGLQAILEGIADISDANTSVASATEQQTQVVDEINRSITEINDLASDSAKRSREIDEISQSLHGYASDLEQQTGRFRV